MTNSEKLIEWINLHGLKLGYISTSIGITQQSLSNKIHNKTEFKASEINYFVKTLGMSIEDATSIFFYGHVE